MTRLSCHSRAISPGNTGPRTVTHGSRGPQVRPYTGLNDANSQADSAGSIPVTRSSVNAAQSAFLLTQAELSPRFRARSGPISGLRPAAYSQLAVLGASCPSRHKTVWLSGSG
jgi:hypothetical protein